MLTKKETKINEEKYKPKRSISSKIGNEDEEENLNSKKLKSRHRKTASSYFLGSYISGNELNKFLQEYKESNSENNNPNNKNLNENGLIKQKNLNIEKKCELNDFNNLFGEKKGNSNKENENVNENIVCLTNASFYSYSIDDDNDNKSKENFEESSVIIKGGDESSPCNNEIISNSYMGNITNNFLTNNPFYELEKSKEKYNKDKSFIPIKNGLKYIKDKDERVTESYLLALKGGESNQKNGKNPYLSTASIIEEEKSEFIESTSKKQSIIAGNRFLKDINFKKKKIENEFNLVKDEKDNIIEKSEDEENKENIDINSNKDLKSNNINKNKNEIDKKNSKREFDLKWKKIKIQKNKKLELQKKCLRKNKENLLNSFFNLSCNRSIPNSQKNKNNDEDASKTSANKKLTTNSNRINNNKNILSDNITQFNLVIKDKINKDSKGRSSANLNNKKRRTYSYNGGYISYLYNQRFNTENNINKTNDKIKLNLSKLVNQKQGKNIIYNAYNNNAKNYSSKKKCKKLNKTMNGSLLSKIKLNPYMKIPHNKFNKSKVQLSHKNEHHFYKGAINISNIKKLNNKLLLDLSNHRKSLSITKIKIDKIPKHRKIFSSGGLDDKINQINININRSITYKKSNPAYICIDNNYEQKNYSQILNQRNKQKIINSKENIRIPTYSDSGTSKAKQKIIYRIINDNERNNSKRLLKIRKANSGLIKFKLDSDIKLKNELNIDISNQNQTLIILNDKIKFHKSFEKIDVLNKIKKDVSNNKKSFIILCEKNKNNENEFNFLGLFKYFENNKRFIKIYGNEEIPNYILLKDINKSNYIIYENKIIQNEENKIQFLFEQLNSFYFSFNSIIICKKLNLN